MIALAFIGGLLTAPALVVGLLLILPDNTPDDLPYGDETRLPDDWVR